MTQNAALGVLDDSVESNLYDPPLRLLKALAAGTVTFTLHGDDTATAGKKITLTLALGDTLREYAIRKIWATGTTIAVANLVGCR